MYSVEPLRLPVFVGGPYAGCVLGAQWCGLLVPLSRVLSLGVPLCALSGLPCCNWDLVVDVLFVGGITPPTCCQ